MRFLHIFWTFSKFLFFYRLTPYRNEILGQRLKRAFEHLGITFIKIGQLLSMRYDLLSESNCKSLQQLLDRVEPIKIETIFAIIEKEYKKPHYEVFGKFYIDPLGSASVSQVRKAKLFDGKIVAVKIKRLDVGRMFVSDIKIMKKLAYMSQFFSSFLRNIQIRQLVDYFERWIEQDLNFVLEVENMKRAQKQYEFGENNFRTDLGKGVFPQPVEMLCTENIIVMDYIDGIPMSRKEEILANPNYNAEKTIKTYVNAAVRNWFRDDFSSYLFQADPHLSNILALPNGDVANIDYGLISELSKKEAKQSRDLIIAVYMKDLENVLRIAVEMTGGSFEKHIPIIKADIEDYLERTTREGFGYWFLEFAKIMVKHNLRFPLYLTTFGRTNVMLDGLLNTYFPEKTTLDIVGEELKRQALNETMRNIKNADWIKLTYTLSQKLNQFPEILNEFIKDPLIIVSKFVSAARRAS